MIWKKFTFETVDSTNTVAADYLIGSVIIAERQTYGRGRYGHTWVSDKGNLYLSVVLKIYGEKTPLMAFVVAVSVAEALKKYGIDIKLKWPNDILLNGAKLAGILLERADDKLIAGIGVNCQTCPDNLPYPAIHLNGRLKPDILADDILGCLNKNLKVFETDGFEPIYCQYKQYVIGIGKKISVRLPNETLTGIFKDLSDSGALILTLPDKSEKHITAGVVLLDERKYDE